VTAPALSRYYRGRPDRRGLLLGYAGVPATEIAAGVARLAQAFEAARAPA